MPINSSNPPVPSSIKIVTVNWDLKDDTLECLESLIAAGASPEQVILVDNGSQDGSVDAIRARFGSHIQVIANPVNYGYVTAINQAIQQAMQAGANWVVLVNNDTVVAPEFFAAFASYLDRPDEYAILAPAIYYYDDPERIWYLGHQLIAGTLLGWSRYHGKIVDRFPPVLPVDFVSGCAMLVRREVFESVGLFDPELVMYGEEVDFVWRARLAGYRCAAIPAAKMWHKVSLSARRVPAQTLYYQIRNQSRFYKRYSYGVKRAAMFLLSAGRTIWLLLVLLIKGNTDLAMPAFYGWLDGWLRPASQPGRLFEPPG